MKKHEIKKQVSSIKTNLEGALMRENPAATGSKVREEITNLENLSDKLEQAEEQ